MNIDRPMASLFFEIKRSMPFEKRDEMKISAPNVGEKLITVYQESSDVKLKALIEDFMQRAGGDWKQQLRSNSGTNIIGGLIQRIKH